VYCSTPRTIVQIVDEFSGMRDAMEELERMDQHVTRLKNICYFSLHETYRRGYTKLVIRRDNANFNDNQQHIAERINPLAKRFLLKAEEILNHFGVNYNEVYAKYKQRGWGPVLPKSKYVPNGFEAEFFLQDYDTNKYQRFLFGFISTVDSNAHIEELERGSREEVIRKYQDWFDDARYDQEAFKEYYNKKFFEDPLDKEERFSVRTFFERYRTPRNFPLSVNRLKSLWASIRFSKQVVPAEEKGELLSDNDINTLRDDIQRLNGGTRNVPSPHSECAQYAYKQQKVLEQRRALLARMYRDRAKPIIRHLFGLVESGVMEVANTYQRKTLQAKFLFATRKIRSVVHRTINDVPRGTMVNMPEGLRIRHQRIASHVNAFSGETKQQNIQLRIGNSEITFHKIKIKVDLSPLLPYFTPMTAVHMYENKYWDELIQKNPENIQQNTTNSSVVSNVMRLLF